MSPVKVRSSIVEPPPLCLQVIPSRAQVFISPVKLFMNFERYESALIVKLEDAGIVTFNFPFFTESFELFSGARAKERFASPGIHLFCLIRKR